MKKFGYVILGIVSVALIGLGIYTIANPFVTEAKRVNTVDEAVNDIEKGIANNEPVVTMVVNKDDFPIEGEFDFDDEYMEYLANEQENLPQYVTLEAVGIISLPAIDIKIPVWNGATTISLRYGAGFYQSSALPCDGELTNTVILAHHMRRSDSMFHKLDQMEIGDDIFFTDMTGRIHTYKVKDVLVMFLADTGEYLAPESVYRNASSITLITCTYTDQGKMRLLVVGEEV